MLSLRKYLLAVHELEMKIYTEEKVLENWEKAKETLNNEYEEEINNLKHTIDTTEENIQTKENYVQLLPQRLQNYDNDSKRISFEALGTDNDIGGTIATLFGFLCTAAIVSSILAYLIDVFSNEQAFDSWTPYISCWSISFLVLFVIIFIIVKVDNNKKPNRIIQKKNEAITENEAITNEIDTLKTELTEMKQELRELKNDRESEIAQITQKINILTNTIRIDKAQLEQLYSTNIIHPKYRSLIPVSMLYEYFDTERCSSLTGANGAYNLYEEELRSQLILDTLGAIVKNIDGMKKSMFFLATRMESSLATINSSMISSADQINGSFAALNAKYSSLQSSTDGILKQLKDGVTVNVE